MWAAIDMCDPSRQEFAIKFRVLEIMQNMFLQPFTSNILKEQSGRLNSETPAITCHCRNKFKEFRKLNSSVIVKRERNSLLNAYFN